MSERHHPDPVERAELSEQDLAIATLVGRYIERREAGQPPRAHDLLAVAAEFGDTAIDALRTVLACYEAMRTATTSRRYARRSLDERPRPQQPDRHRSRALRGPFTRITRDPPSDRSLERRQPERGALVVRRRDPDLRRRPDRQDPRAAALAALPPRPRLAAVLTVAAR